MSNATVDALGMCFSHIPLLVWLIASSDDRENCIHIGVGFDVARSTIQGNAKASVRGTSNEEIPRFPFILIANLGMKGWLGKEFLWIIEKQKNCVKSGVISLNYYLTDRNLD